MLNTVLSSEIELHVREMLAVQGIDHEPDLNIQIEHPMYPEHGEYSTNIAMKLAKALRKSPLHIAEDLQQRMEQQGNIGGLVARIQVAAPGFLNFHLNWAVWAAGHIKAPNGSASKVIIEHTSINPNKSAHIGHLRNSCIGDALARMLRYVGHEVEVHNYIDDLGNQLADTVVGILNTSAEHSHARFGDYCWDTYAKINQSYKVNSELQEARVQVLQQLEEGHSNMAWIGSLVAERIVREQLDEMKQFGIGYDVLVWESNIVREGFWASTFDLLQQTSVFRQVTEGKLSGCWVLKQSEELPEAGGDMDYQADKVLVRSNGILTYTAKDIAYHMWKFGILEKDFTYTKFAERVWTTHPKGVRKTFGRADTVINVIDQRQQYPQAMVKLALEVLGYPKQAEQLKHVSYGVVSLSPQTAASLGVDTSDGKSSYAMSGRQGIGIKVSDLLDQMEHIIHSKRKRKQGLSSRSIAAAAIRYYLLKYHLQTEVVFDLQQATEVSGNSGVYLLYSYARANSILDKAAQAQYLSNGFPPPQPDSNRLSELEPQEQLLFRQLAYWPESLQLSINQLAPNLICSYAFELASTFNNFYSACPIMKASEEQRELRLWLTQRFKDTLHQALQVLGLPTPKRM